MSEETALARIEQPPPTSALVDLRSSMMSVPSDVMALGLAEYKERRQTFREWLRSQLVEGVHYGYPPGCEPKFDNNGNVLVWMKGGYKPFPVEQWQPKPSLYKAGADFVCDLMGLIDIYDADMAAWEQLGKPGGTFVFRCRLYPKGAKQSEETLIGEGWGVRFKGQKGGDENNAIKMAKKSAKVDSILNAYGLADLFTQDIEDMPPPGPAEHPNPAPRADAPKVQPRGKRAEKEDCEALFGEWLAFRTEMRLPKSKAHYSEWVEAETGMARAEVFTVASWTFADIEKCRTAMKMERGEPNVE